MVKWELFDGDLEYTFIAIGVDENNGEFILSDGSSQIFIEDLNTMKEMRKLLKKAITLRVKVNDEKF